MYLLLFIPFSNTFTEHLLSPWHQVGLSNTIEVSHNCLWVEERKTWREEGWESFQAGPWILKVRMLGFFFPLSSVDLTMIYNKSLILA